MSTNDSADTRTSASESRAADGKGLKAVEPEVSGNAGPVSMAVERCARGAQFLFIN